MKLLPVESGNGSDLNISLINRDFYRDQEENNLKNISVSQTGKNFVKISFPDISELEGSPLEDQYYNSMLKDYNKFRNGSDVADLGWFGSFGDFHARLDERNEVVLDRLDPCIEKRLLNPDMTNLPIPEGVFKGDYSSHGIEIIAITYPENDILLGTKITGDPNVPMNKVTFKADLKKALVLNKSDQQEMGASDLQKYALDEENHHEINFSAKNFVPVSQPFYLHNFFEKKYFEPNQCRFRFVAEAQVAYDNYTDPSFIAAQLVIFDCDNFAVLFLDLNSASYYSRVKEDLTSEIH